MELTPLADDCRNTTCPAAFATDRGTFVIQGYEVTDPAALRQLGLPDGETAVEVPRSLVEKIIGAIGT